MKTRQYKSSDYSDYPPLYRRQTAPRQRKNGVISLFGGQMVVRTNGESL